MSSKTPFKKLGRPVGSGRYGEQTKVMRVPTRLADKIAELCLNDNLDGDEGTTLPLYGSRVQAGSPVGADEFVEAQVNLHSHLVRRPDATFFVRAQGQSMINAGIFDGDLLVVDRSLVAKNGNIVVVALDGALTVKRLDNSHTGKVLLLPENPSYPAIEVGEGQDFHIWGVVTSVVHEFGNRAN